VKPPPARIVASHCCVRSGDVLLLHEELLAPPAVMDRLLIRQEKDAGIVIAGKEPRLKCECEQSPGRTRPDGPQPQRRGVFQYLAARQPFDGAELRREFLERLNKIPGVDLPAVKIALRPGFSLEVLASLEARTLFVDALDRFYQQANASAEWIEQPLDTV
jgi:hypothetical protein